MSPKPPTPPELEILNGKIAQMKSEAVEQFHDMFTRGDNPTLVDPSDHVVDMAADGTVSFKLDAEVAALKLEICEKIGVTETPTPDQQKLLDKIDAQLDVKIDAFVEEQLLPEIFIIYKKHKSDSPDPSEHYKALHEDIQMVTERVYIIKMDFLRGILKTMIYT